MTASFIRAMSKTLVDRDIDPLYEEDFVIGTALVCAGWSVKEINTHFEAVKTMTAIWFANKHRNRSKRFC